MKKLLLPMIAICMTGFATAQPSSGDLKPFTTGLHICGAISIDSDENVRISEWSSERVGIYDKSGKLLRTIDGVGDPSGNCFDEDGNFYVCAYSYGHIYRITPEGEKSVYASGFDVPAGISWIDGHLHVANRDAGELVRIESNGKKTVLARGLPQPVSCLKLKDGAFIISCLDGSPHILEADGTLSVLIPEITSSGINIIQDGEDAFIFCAISDGTVERVTLYGKTGKRTVKREILAKGFSTPIGVARLPDGRIIFDAWGQSAAYILEP